MTTCPRCQAPAIRRDANGVRICQSCALVVAHAQEVVDLVELPAEPETLDQLRERHEARVRASDAGARRTDRFVGPDPAVVVVDPRDEAIARLEAEVERLRGGMNHG